MSDSAIEQFEPITVELKKGCMVDGNRVYALTIEREPTAGDYCILTNGATTHQQVQALLSFWFAIPPSSIKALHPEDYKTLIAAAAPFLSGLV